MTGASAAAALQPGTVLGGFRLLESIGSDGLGELYRAQNVHAPKLLRAVRVIRPDLAAQPDFRRQLLQVAELLDGLEHPNLLRIHHLGEQQELLFTVQDLLLGRTLRAITQEQRALPPVSVAADWVYQALCGLAYAHHHGVIHQDLKPDSLFLTQSGVVKVVDFEMVRLGEFAAARHAHGKPGILNAPTYFAPEFAEGASASPTSDVYAMGLCLYEFLAGQPPYRPGGGTDTQVTISILLQHLTKPLPDLRPIRKDIPDGLLAVLTKATAKQPAARYQSADDFGAALLPYLGHHEANPHIKSDVGHPAAHPQRELSLGDPRAADHPESSVIELGWNDAAPSDGDHPDGHPGPIDRHTDRHSDGHTDSPSSHHHDRRNKHQDHSTEPEPGSPLEITAPQPTLGEVPEMDAGSAHGLAKEPFTVKLRYLIIGVLATLAIIASTVAMTAYLLRSALRGERLSVETKGPAEPVSMAPAPGPRTPVSTNVAAGPGARPDMVQVPAGTFRMGSRDGYADERPEHVEAVNAFWIDQHEVTVGEYDKCVSSGECRKQKTIHQADADRKYDRFCNYGRKSRDDHPMNCVDWYQARAYCRWLGKRLPTETEWEYAARGSDGRKFPWGSEGPSESLLNACGRECVILGGQIGKKWNSMYPADDGWDATAPAGSFPHDKSPFGVLDLAGNVAEWTDTEYAKCYRDDCEPNGKERVIRGGAWNDDAQNDVRTAYRNRDVPLMRGSFVGFRCAKNDAPSAPLNR